AFGRVSFPFCDWSLTLYSDQHAFLAGEAVNLSIEHEHAFWRRGGRSGTPFLIMRRDDCLKMLLDNEEQLYIRRLKFPDPQVRPRLQFANRLGRSEIRYEPIGFENFDEHAGLTGALIQGVIAAIRRNSPVVYHELCAFIHAVRGFELPESAHGV